MARKDREKKDNARKFSSICLGARRLLGITQETVAKEAGIERSSLAHFELMSDETLDLLVKPGRLGQQTKLKMARILRLSPDWIYRPEEIKNPFGTNNIFFCPQSGKNMNNDNAEDGIRFLTGLGIVAEIVALIPVPISPLKRLIEREPVKVLIVWDINNNIFIILHRQNKYLFPFERLQLLEKKIEMPFVVRDERVSDDLLSKISSQSIAREELEQRFLRTAPIFATREVGENGFVIRWPVDIFTKDTLSYLSHGPDSQQKKIMIRRLVEWYHINLLRDGISRTEIEREIQAAYKIFDIPELTVEDQGSLI